MHGALRASYDASNTDEIIDPKYEKYAVPLAPLAQTLIY